MFNHYNIKIYMYRILYNIFNFVSLKFNFLIMEITNYTTFRQSLKFYLDKVFSNHTPLFVTRAKGEDVVVMSKADYDSMQETFYLLKNPANAVRLEKGLKDYEKGLTQKQELIDNE